MNKKSAYINRLAVPAVAALSLSMLPACSTTTRKQTKSTLDAMEQEERPSETVSVSKEKTKKFEGLSDSQKGILFNHGVRSIKVETPRGHKETALQFDPDAEVTVERTGRVRLSGDAPHIKIPSQATLYITHHDTASVEVRKREMSKHPDTMLVTVRVNNTDGSVTFIHIETDEKNMTEKNK